MTENDFSDIDEIMALDPLALSTKPGTEGRRKLDKIIAYERHQRTQREQGVKVKKPKLDRAPGQSIESLLSNLVLQPAPPAPKPKSTMRRRV
jgi:hypothetical protein